jgi:hypothetical protein
MEADEEMKKKLGESAYCWGACTTHAAACWLDILRIR